MIASAVNWWARIVVERACIVFFVCLALALGVSGAGAYCITQATIDGGTDAFGIQGSSIAQRQQAWSYRWIQDGSVSYDRRRALQAKKAGTALNSNRNTNSGSALTVDHKTKRSDRELMSYSFNSVDLYLYYTSTADNVLTEASLREIAAAEKQLLADWAARFPGDGLSYSSGGSVSGSALGSGSGFGGGGTVCCSAMSMACPTATRGCRKLKIPRDSVVGSMKTL